MYVLIKVRHVRERIVYVWFKLRIILQGEQGQKGSKVNTATFLCWSKFEYMYLYSFNPVTYLLVLSLYPLMIQPPANATIVQRHTGGDVCVFVGASKRNLY